jgi:hypothetical protein
MEIFLKYFFFALLDENLYPTSTNSVDPIIPYSSAPQLISIIVRRGRHPREKSGLPHMGYLSIS